MYFIISAYYNEKLATKRKNIVNIISAMMLQYMAKPNGHDFLDEFKNREHNISRNTFCWTCTSLAVGVSTSTT